MDKEILTEAQEREQERKHFQEWLDMLAPGDKVALKGQGYGWRDKPFMRAQVAKPGRTPQGQIRILVTDARHALGVIKFDPRSGYSSLRRDTSYRISPITDEIRASWVAIEAAEAAQKDRQDAQAAAIRAQSPVPQDQAVEFLVNLWRELFRSKADLAQRARTISEDLARLAAGGMSNSCGNAQNVSGLETATGRAYALENVLEWATVYMGSEMVDLARSIASKNT